MRTETKGKVWTITFDSLDELATQAPELAKDWNYLARSREWNGGVTGAKAQKLARSGWEDHLDDTLTAAESAVAKVEREQTLPVFLPTFDVTGCDIDMGRFLSGEPECMVDYPLTEIVKAGKVITLCASLSISGAVTAESLTRRGKAVTALALALSRCGYAIEIIADLTATREGHSTVIRCMVKRAEDVLDPARILYALAHPSMLRTLGFAAQDAAPEPFYRTVVKGNRGRPADPTEDLPEGTLYLPAVWSDRDIPDLDVALMRYLRDLDIVTE